MPEPEQGVEQQTGDDEEDGCCDRKHKHRQGEDGVRWRAGRIKDIRGRLGGRCPSNQGCPAQRSQPGDG